ncbi:MAG: DUF4177 domain-containing protein [Verrucomicrobiota bacterium]
MAVEKYEYKILKFDGKGWFLGGKLDLLEIEQDFNEMGQAGWELVSTMDTNEAQGATKWVVATFKRRLP